MPPHGVPALDGEPVGDACRLPASLAHPTTLGQFTSIERFADLGGAQPVVESDFLYDNAARLTDLTHRQGSTVLADVYWVYDAFSRVTGSWSPTDDSSSERCQMSLSRFARVW
ncbi:MAG: hypothetical protein FJ276_08630 [Planctomycetes bacterium]|nr:hypothetical protein [Planctomycetota bacterium]